MVGDTLQFVKQAKMTTLCILRLFSVIEPLSPAKRDRIMACLKMDILPLSLGWWR